MSRINSTRAGFDTGLLYLIFYVRKRAGNCLRSQAARQNVFGIGGGILCIDVYTRFFEQFWNTLSKSIFFISLGTLSLVVGIFLEFSRRNKFGGKKIERQSHVKISQSD